MLYIYMIIIYTPTGRSTKTHNQCVIRNQDLWLQPATHRYRIDITLIATGHEDGEMWHPGNEYLVWVYMCSSNLELLCILLHICIIMCIIYIYTYNYTSLVVELFQFMNKLPGSIIIYNIT